ncbi:hypothetical protein HJC23_009590 [Cyclotella cryptica]|uniref:Uncharacterized protein n=1 Tax=Cyclotella cryptica TaxID=29204 RepID=A0ABD3PQ43_9STRA
MSARHTVQGLSLFSALCVCAAFILNWYSTVACNFISVALTYGSSSDPSSVSLHFGIWNYQSWTVVSSSSGTVVFQGCWRYPDYVEVDPEWKAAKAFSVMALVFGLALMLAVLFSACSGKGAKQVTPASGVGFFICSLFSGLSLLLLGSDLCKENVLSEGLESMYPNSNMSVASCGISAGAKCSISATILWFLAGVSSCRAYKVEVESVQDELTGGPTTPLVNDMEMED